MVKPAVFSSVSPRSQVPGPSLGSPHGQILQLHGELHILRFCGLDFHLDPELGSFREICWVMNMEKMMGKIYGKNMDWKKYGKSTFSQPTFREKYGKMLGLFREICWEN
jgi:hypothetical protein